MNDFSEYQAINDESAFRIWVVKLLTKLEVRMDDQIAARADIENRIRAVESKLWWAIGAACAFSGIATFLSRFIR